MATITVVEADWQAHVVEAPAGDSLMRAAVGSSAAACSARPAGATTSATRTTTITATFDADGSAIDTLASRGRIL